MSVTGRNVSCFSGAVHINYVLKGGLLKDGKPLSHDNLDRDRTYHNLRIYTHAAYRVLPPRRCLSSRSRRVDVRHLGYPNPIAAIVVPV